MLTLKKRKKIEYTYYNVANNIQERFMIPLKQPNNTGTYHTQCFLNQS